MCGTLEFFYWTGMRPGEIRSLTWTVFNREAQTLCLEAKNSKTRKPRTIPLAGPLQEIFQRRMKARRFGCDRISPERKSDGGIPKAMERACHKAGVADRIPYDLRRTAIRNMVRAGVSENVAMS